MLRKYNNDYITIQELVEDSQLFFDAKLSEFFETSSEDVAEIKNIIAKKLRDVTTDNFIKQFSALTTEIQQVLNKTNHKSNFLIDIKIYLEEIYRYIKQEEPDIISSNDFKWESDEQRNNEWKFATEKLTQNGRLLPDGSKLRRKDSDNNLSHSYIVIGRRILAMGPKKSSIMSGLAMSASNVKLAEDKNRGSWALKVLAGRQQRFDNDSKVAADLGMGLALVERESKPEFKTAFFKSYIPYVYAGTTLSEYLKTPREIDEYCDIAISLLENIIDLHSGIKSHSKTKYVHGDLHFANITIDNKRKTHFIDFERARELSLGTGQREAVRLVQAIYGIFKGKIDQYPQLQKFIDEINYQDKFLLSNLLTGFKDIKEQLFPATRKEIRR